MSCWPGTSSTRPRPSRSTRTCGRRPTTTPSNWPSAVDEIQAGIEDTASDIAAADEQIERAQIELSAARAAVEQNASGHADPGEAAWERLRFCESGGVYTTNSGNGFYGAYQFDRQTWESMGGSGLPSAAPYWEQDIRAKALYWARGPQPWPVCGRFIGG